MLLPENNLKMVSWQWTSNKPYMFHEEFFLQLANKRIIKAKGKACIELTKWLSGQDRILKMKCILISHKLCNNPWKSPERSCELEKKWLHNQNIKGGMAPNVQWGIYDFQWSLLMDDKNATQ